MKDKEKEMFINETQELIELTKKAINVLTTKKKRLKDLLRILKN
tara:strand:- start:515 stop:646 length:132 start_codon:yes stop_codon:yes gene_type:complete